MRWPLRWPFHDAAGHGPTVARDTGTPGTDPTGGGPVEGSPVAGPQPVRRDWASLPPLQRSFAAPALTAESDAFARAVAADAALPLALAPLGHAREAHAPGGLVRGLATAVADRTAVDVGGARAGLSQSMPAPTAGAAAIPGGQHEQRAAGVPGRRVQRVVAGPRGGRAGESTAPDNGADSVGIGSLSAVGTPAGAVSDAQRAMSSTTTGTPDASGVGPTSSVASSMPDDAGSPVAHAGLPPIQRLHDLPVRTSGSASSPAGRHASLVSADVTLPASPSGLLRRGAAENIGPTAIPAPGDHDEPGAGSTDLQRSVGPASGSTPAPDRPVRLSVGQVRRLGLGTPFTQTPTAGRSPTTGGASASSDLPSLRRESPIDAAPEVRPAGVGAPRGPEIAGPAVSRAAVSRAAVSRAAVSREIAAAPQPGADLARRESLASPTGAASQMPLAETPGQRRLGASDTEVSPESPDHGHHERQDRTAGGDTVGWETDSRGVASDQASAVGTGSPPEPPTGAADEPAAHAHAPTMSAESLAAPSRPRPGLGAPATTPAIHGTRGHDRGGASAGMERPFAQRTTIDPDAQVVPLPAPVRVSGAAASDRHQSTHDGEVGFPTGAIAGPGVAESPRRPSSVPARVVVSRSVGDAPGSLVAATPGRARAPLVPPHPQTPSASPRSGTTHDEPMTLVRAFHAAIGGSSGTDGAALSARQPTVARSVAGQAGPPDLTDDGSVGVVSAGAGAPHESTSLASVQREDGSDAAVAAAASSVTAGGGAPAGGSERELDELARRLYDRIRSRLRTELLVDRERAGALSDLV